jgi:two-component system, NarL family, nitrate/nitrite response regulator NarL
MKGGARILVADDHPLFRAALSELFQRDKSLTLIAAVADLAAALDILNEQSCDLAVLDVRMPGMDGLAGVSKVRERCPEAKIALISGDIDATTVAAGMIAGVTGFLPKSFDPDVILAAVKLVLAGGTYVPHGLPGPDPGPAPAAAPVAAPAANGAAGPLSEREREILTLMARGSSHKEIGRALGIAEVTVKLHTQRIVRKLQVKNRAVAIAKAVKDGLIEPA